MKYKSFFLPDWKSSKFGVLKIKQSKSLHNLYQPAEGITGALNDSSIPIIINSMITEQLQK